MQNTLMACDVCTNSGGSDRSSTLIICNEEWSDRAGKIEAFHVDETDMLPIVAQKQIPLHRRQGKTYLLERTIIAYCLFG